MPVAADIDDDTNGAVPKLNAGAELDAAVVPVPADVDGDTDGTVPKLKQGAELETEVDGAASADP